MKTHFRDFLLSGQVGPLRCGVEKGAVVASMGQPRNWYLKGKDFVSEPVRDFMQSDGWSYGYIAVVFDSEACINGISVHVGEHRGPLPSFCSGYWPLNFAPLAELKHFLLHEKIGFVELPKRPLGFAMVIADHTLVSVRGLGSILRLLFHRDSKRVRELIE